MGGSPGPRQSCQGHEEVQLSSICGDLTAVCTSGAWFTGQPPTVLWTQLTARGSSLSSWARHPASLHSPSDSRAGPPDSAGTGTLQSVVHSLTAWPRSPHPAKWGRRLSQPAMRLFVWSVRGGAWTQSLLPRPWYTCTEALGEGAPWDFLRLVWGCRAVENVPLLGTPWSLVLFHFFNRHWLIN